MYASILSTRSAAESHLGAPMIPHDHPLDLPHRHPLHCAQPERARPRIRPAQGSFFVSSESPRHPSPAAIQCNIALREAPRRLVYLWHRPLAFPIRCSEFRPISWYPQTSPILNATWGICATTAASVSFLFVRLQPHFQVHSHHFRLRISEPSLLRASNGAPT